MKASRWKAAPLSNEIVQEEQCLVQKPRKWSKGDLEIASRSTDGSYAVFELHLNGYRYQLILDRNEIKNLHTQLREAIEVPGDTQ